MAAEFLKRFSRECSGGTILIFGLTLPVVLLGIGIASNYARATSQKTAAQATLDAAALGAVSGFNDPNATASTIEAAARNHLNAQNASAPGVAGSQVLVDPAEPSVLIIYKASVDVPFKLPGISKTEVAARAKATIKHKRQAICILITEPTDNHTLLGKDGAKILFEDCVVQVNTKNWDAVEMRNGASLYSTNGQNCFVGDIHYGDVRPGKTPNCKFFDDPFLNLPLPNSTACAHTNIVVNATAALAPGTYCGGIVVNASTTFKPGVYVLKDGPLQIVGSGTNVTAEGVTFVLTGKNAGLAISTNGTLKFSPSTAAVGGELAGFVFYLDQNSDLAQPQKGSKKNSAKSVIIAATVNLSGIIYLRGQEFTLKDATVNVDRGAIVADYLLPERSKLNLKGTLQGVTNAEIAMRKAVSERGDPVLTE